VSRRIIVHSLGDAIAALEAARSLGVPVTLMSAPGAGSYTGPRWFLAVVAEAARTCPGAAFDSVIDCADESGTVLGALRAGAKRVRFTGPAAARRKLEAIAAHRGAALEGEAEAPALDLLQARDPLAACRVYLGA
jgi:hypothetical protein